MHIAHLAREWSNPLPVVVVWTEYYTHLTDNVRWVYNVYTERGETHEILQGLYKNLL